MKPCNKCHKTIDPKITKNDTCSECGKKYPYFLSFVEEGYVGVNDVVFGRVEIYTNLKPKDYAIDELRFMFPDTQKKEKFL